MSDDDLPLLTHVLRTGNRPMPASAATPIDPTLDEGFDDRFDVHPFDEGPLTRQIVIGHEQPVARTGLTAMAIYDDDPPISDESRNDPHARAAHDAFGLSQDADASRPALMTAIDAPPIDVAAAASGAERRALSIDTPIDFSVPSDTAQWAARVRESVMDDLVTRIDTELDARIAQAMHIELETSLAQLQDRLRSHLTDALRDVVARAVNEEIIRIRRSNGDAATS